MKHIKHSHTIETDKVKSGFTLDKNGKTWKINTRSKDRRNIGGLIVIHIPPEDFAAKGGTSMYCPSCKCVRRCEVDTYQSSGPRNWHKTKHSDVQWFRRSRMCRTCFYQFVTAEVQEDFLTELVSLRDAIVRGETISAKDLSNYGDNILMFPNKE